jgi:hypothetical protein
MKQYEIKNITDFFDIPDDRLNDYVDEMRTNENKLYVDSVENNGPIYI